MSRNLKRPYDSSRRAEQAAETRRRIIGAARDLFVERGYGRTTIASIAERAGVSAESVYAGFKNKANLLRHVWYVVSRGDDEDVTLYDRAEMQSILAEPDLRRRIRRHAAFVTAANRRMAPLLGALEGAAASEPDAAAMLAESCPSRAGRTSGTPNGSRHCGPRRCSDRSRSGSRAPALFGCRRPDVGLAHLPAHSP